MSRRVVCSHGSSLSTAVQYAGQGKVTLLCVRARARARLLSPRGAPYYRTYTSLHSIRSLSRCDSIVPDRLGSGATIRCPTEKPASLGTGFRCTRVFVRLAVELVAYRAHRFHCGLSHVAGSTGGGKCRRTHVPIPSGYIRRKRERESVFISPSAQVLPNRHYTLPADSRCFIVNVFWKES
ncbi:hypothetical protein ALC53_07397 [Atta colombica]|uniref:Uncharacterized protein n=1 Tax=Atta colombica TaxID=520822 RepID=A0A195BD74_9HYME|nr:hypothetical protein ALC53_07397 [Atta colombica]